MLCVIYVHVLCYVLNSLLCEFRPSHTIVRFGCPPLNPYLHDPCRPPQNASVGPCQARGGRPKAISGPSRRMQNRRWIEGSRGGSKWQPNRPNAVGRCRFRPMCAVSRWFGLFPETHCPSLGSSHRFHHRRAVLFADAAEAPPPPASRGTARDPGVHAPLSTSGNKWVGLKASQFFFKKSVRKIRFF